MVMWKFRSCPRCGGDIFIEGELDDWYEQCLQCGYLHYLPSRVEVYKHGDDKKKKEFSRLHSQYP